MTVCSCTSTSNFILVIKENSKIDVFVLLQMLLNGDVPIASRMPLNLPPPRKQSHVEDPPRRNSRETYSPHHVADRGQAPIQSSTTSSLMMIHWMVRGHCAKEKLHPNNKKSPRSDRGMTALIALWLLN